MKWFQELCSQAIQDRNAILPENRRRRSSPLHCISSFNLVYFLYLFFSFNLSRFQHRQHRRLLNIFLSIALPRPAVLVAVSSSNSSPIPPSPSRLPTKHPSLASQRRSSALALLLVLFKPPSVNFRTLHVLRHPQHSYRPSDAPRQQWRGSTHSVLFPSYTKPDIAIQSSPSSSPPSSKRRQHQQTTEAEALSPPQSGGP